MRAMLAYRALMERKGRLRALLDLSAPSPATLPSKRLHPPTSLLAECEIDFMSLDVVWSEAADFCKFAAVYSMNIPHASHVRSARAGSETEASP